MVASVTVERVPAGAGKGKGVRGMRTEGWGGTAEEGAPVCPLLLWLALQALRHH